MALFTNDLREYIEIIQLDEMLSAQTKRVRKNATKTYAYLTTVILSNSLGLGSYLLTDNPKYLYIGVGGVVISSLASVIYDEYQKRKYFKSIQNGSKNVMYERIGYTAAYHFEKEEAEEINEQFGHESDNDLPIQFLEKELIRDRLIREYELYRKRYNLPELNITDEELDTYINQIEISTSKTPVAHRLFHHTREYFRLIIAKSILYNWEQINRNTLIENVDLFEILNLDETTIKTIEANLRESFIKEKNESTKIKK